MPAVGRKRTKHKNLPPLVTLKRGRYYYGRNQEFLADNLADALLRWAEREAAKEGRRPVTFKGMADEYLRLVIPLKSPRTRKDNLTELEHLLSIFGSAPLEKLQPVHVRGYLDNRPAKIRGNREVALLSAIWNWGRDQGMTTLPNPCTGVKRHKESGRDRYVTDEEFIAVWEASDAPLRDALELHLLTGQRPGDVLKMTLSDAREGSLWLRQGKTRKPLRVTQEGALAALLERIRAQQFKGGVVSLALVRDEDGQAMTYDALFNRFEKARKAAGVHFQLRDLRAKAATDLEDLALAQRLLGHSSRSMTEHYVKRRAGDRVSPLLRTPARIADKKNGAD